GFGSMTGGDPVARARAVIEGARLAGHRVLVTTGWGGLEVPVSSLGDDVLVTSAVPHDAVLPRAAVAMHHAGAGTAHAVARAGIPAITVPFLADQPFWAAQLHRRGLAPRALHRDRLTAATVQAAIEQAHECDEQAMEVA